MSNWPSPKATVPTLAVQTNIIFYLETKTLLKDLQIGSPKLTSIPQHVMMGNSMYHFINVIDAREAYQQWSCILLQDYRKHLSCFA